MTEQALEKLKEQLQCGVCLETYTDPKQLHCNHIYCRECLVQLVFRDQMGELVLACPVCRKVMPVPSNGVSGFQSAFHINHLLEIQDSINLIGSRLESRSAARVSPPSDRFCLEHPEEQLKLYCETCLQLICLQCAIKGGKHQSHVYQFVEKAFEEYRGEVETSLEPMERQLASVHWHSWMHVVGNYLLSKQLSKPT